MASVLGLPSTFDPVMFYGLGVIPFTFSSLFFAIPIVRSLALGGENRARMRRNVRRLLVPGLVYSVQAPGPSAGSRPPTRSTT